MIIRKSNSEPILKSDISSVDLNFLEGVLNPQTIYTGDYFKDLPQYLLPINLYHEFYLYWWFSWYIMIGQFLARFVGGIRTYQLLLMILIIPSIPLGLWFSVIYIYHQNNIDRKLPEAKFGVKV